jgi:AcrR family transcriptional regulator
MTRADTNRRHILGTALAELLHEPDASMDQIARAAGVVRRTVYGHFPTRDALISTLVDEAVDAVIEAHARGREGATEPGRALAGAVAAVWETADRYRLLVGLAQRSVSMEGIRRRLEPVREQCLRLIQWGLDEGEFATPVPAAALAYVHEQQLFGMMEAVNDDAIPAAEAGRAAATTALLSVGVTTARAEDIIRELRLDRPADRGGAGFTA